MPKSSIKYQNTIIYKIVCNDLNVKDVYVGHTTDFRKRKNQHKSNCIKEDNHRHNLKIYKTIRENGGWDNWSVIEIEKFPCNDSNEASARERYWFELLQANLNMFYPQRKKEEYIENNKEHLREMQKIYRCTNKDKIKELQKIYRENNKDNVKEYKKEFYEKNKDKIKERVALYKINNKDKIAARKKQQIVCDCGKTYTRGHTARHNKTKKHITFIEQQNNL